MSRMVARLLLSIAVPPLAVLVFIGVVLLCHEARSIRNESDDFVVAAVTMMLFLHTCWALVWGPAVQWTSGRVGRTILALVGSWSCGWFVAKSLNAAIGRGSAFEELTTTLGAFVAGATWIFFSALAWRETPTERAARIAEASGLARSVVCELKCPACGYLMNGLTHARCPECGAEYTLETLVAASLEAARPEAELEQ